MIIWKSYIMCPHYTHLPVFPCLPSPVTSPSPRKQVHFVLSMYSLEQTPSGRLKK